MRYDQLQQAAGQEWQTCEDKSMIEQVLKLAGIIEPDHWHNIMRFKML
jgi:hypothetical protein